MNRLINSSNNIEKEYLARVNGHLGLDMVAKLKKVLCLMVFKQSQQRFLLKNMISNMEQHLFV